MSGAGMSVDSGLPDFASDQGIIQQVVKSEPNKDYRHIINPAFFHSNPEKFWYIYGHRYNQYVHATPHKGYHLLKKICFNKQYHTYTSNVDGMWTKAGFKNDKVYELHGSIFHLQCFQC